MMKKKTWIGLAFLLMAACGSTSAGGDGPPPPEPPLPPPPAEITGIWSSRAELASIPMSGTHWNVVLASANKNTLNPDVSDQNDNTNCYVLAAAIACERYLAAGKTTEAASYRTKVVTAIEKIVAVGHPAGSRSLAWAREIGAYAMAADLIGYRTTAFEQYLRAAATQWKCSERNQTLHAMSVNRPNNWGSMGFGTLCAIYAYLGEMTALRSLRDTWMTTFTGPSAASFKFGSDLTWQADPLNPMVINPKNAMKGDFILDGLQPEEMRRGAPEPSFQVPPATTDYPFEALQGLVMAARILDRQGMSVWDVGDKALYRAVYALQTYLAGRFGEDWTFRDDDRWMLDFIDEAYGSSFSKNSYSDTRGHGKNAGFPYVTLVPKSL